jgi:hypothetical protein
VRHSLLTDHYVSPAPEITITQMPIVKKVQSVEDFEKLIEKYKVQNPVKFAMKEKALLEKLAGLKKLAGHKSAEQK